MKRLYRSRKNRVIAGVCGGLGEYFEVDPVLIRVVFIALTFLNGAGIILYLILAVIIPKEPVSEKEAEIEKEKEPAKKIAESARKAAEDLAEDVKSLSKELKEEGSWLSEKRNLLALALIILGIILLLEISIPWFAVSWRFFWPALLIIIGIYIILKR